jgi:hypothetical protein
MTNSFQIAAYCVTWISFLLAILSCLVRVYSCVFVMHSWKAEDYMSVAVGVSKHESLFMLDCTDLRHRRQLTSALWCYGKPC